MSKFNPTHIYLKDTPQEKPVMIVRHLKDTAWVWIVDGNRIKEFVHEDKLTEIEIVPDKKKKWWQVAGKWIGGHWKELLSAAITIKTGVREWRK